MIKQMLKKIKLITIILIIVISNISFSAVVSDNDGSAFISKSEFDSLKSNFQAQIDYYNTSIDSKIDEAIASYLSGIKISSKYPLSLDENCEYLFPLYLYANNNNWNEPQYTDMYDSSVPKVKILKLKYYASRNKNDTGTKISSRGGSVSRTTFVNNENIIFRFGIQDEMIDYDGSIGQLFIVKKNLSSKRKVNSTNYYTFERVKATRGQYILVYKDDAENGSYSDSGPATNEAFQYNYINFMGFSGTHITNSGKTFTWTGSETEGPVWTHNAVVNYKGIGGNTKTFTPNSSNLLASKKMSNVLTYFRGTVGSESSSWDRSQNFFGTPKSLVLEEEKVGTNRIYAQGANMPASLEKQWALTAYAKAASADTLVDSVISYAQNPTKNYAFNFTTVTLRLYYFQGTNYVVWPKFRPKKNTTFAQDTSNEFSQMRASLVYYKDSKGKTHYMDEGMFLANIEKDGTVKLNLKFEAAAGTQLQIAFSKKPFSWDYSDSDIIPMEYNEVSSTTRVKAPKGEKTTISSGVEYSFTIKDLAKDDQLYLCWWGNPSTNKCYLESLTEFTFESAN